MNRRQFFGTTAVAAGSLVASNVFASKQIKQQNGLSDEEMTCKIDLIGVDRINGYALIINPKQKCGSIIEAKHMLRTCDGQKIIEENVTIDISKSISISFGWPYNKRYERKNNRWYLIGINHREINVNELQEMLSELQPSEVVS